MVDRWMSDAEFERAERVAKDAIGPRCDALITMARDALRLREALVGLANKLASIEVDPSYRAIWEVAHAHGWQYSGPSYARELNAARVLLAEIEARRASRSIRASRHGVRRKRTTAPGACKYTSRPRRSW